MFLDGDGFIEYGGGEKEKFSAGDTFLIPACLKNYKISGDCDILRCLLP